MNEYASNEFERIYHTSEWQSRSRSGPGSLPELNLSYLQVLQTTLVEHNIKSVVDIGCGDWTLYQSAFDWYSKDVSYLGIDLVPELVDRLNKAHRRDNVEFRRVDINGASLPEADLYILKDVLQHWPNERIVRFLPQLKRSRLTLITNDMEIYSPRKRPFRKLFQHLPFTNVDTTFGGYRPLRLREPPFNLTARLLHNYSMDWEGWLFVKETLLCGNEAGASATSAK
jgi:SAM-dependent methyltransferase